MISSRLEGSGRQAMGDRKHAALTARQREVYEFIVERFERAGRPPTMRELGSALGITSTNGVRCFLEALETKGFIERDPGLARGIRLPRVREAAREVARRAASMVQVPLVGEIAAGSPILAEEDIEETLSLDPLLVPAGEGSFALRVRGDSMTGAGILAGDLVIIRPGSHAAQGEIVAAFWEGEATVKRFFRKGTDIVLHPENPAYSDIRIHPKQEDFRVLGTVIGVVRRVRPS
jgi:repressor LexA